MSNDADGAIADFESAVRFAVDSDYSSAFTESRQAWVEALRAGEDPFDEETLAELRTE